MRIAIYEPQLRVAGPVNYVHHLREGLVELGHHCDVVTFNRSGKESKTWGEDGRRDHIRWWHRHPQLVDKFENAAEVLNSYDRVLLSDARITVQNKLADKGEGSLEPDYPDYLAVLLRTRTPFTYALHSNTYPEEEVKYLHRATQADHFLGRGITYSLREPDLERPLFRDTTWYHSRLPYRSRLAVNADFTRNGTVGITGRYVPNKGHHVVGLTGGTGRLPGIDVELWGACSVGAGPSQTFKTYEALTEQLQLEGERFGNQPDTPRGGNILRAFPWIARRPDGTSVRYLGSYSDAVETCRRLDVHVNVTSSNYSNGMDYVVLESVDAGCLQVAVKSSWDPDFVGVQLDEVSKLHGEKQLLGTEEGGRQLDLVADAVHDALDVRDRGEVVKHNRTVLQKNYHPTIAAAKVVEMLEGA